MTLCPRCHGTGTYIEKVTARFVWFACHGWTMRRDRRGARRYMKCRKRFRIRRDDTAGCELFVQREKRNLQNRRPAEAMKPRQLTCSKCHRVGRPGDQHGTTCGDEYLVQTARFPDRPSKWARCLGTLVPSTNRRLTK
jgi:hypothetical protein